MLKFGVEPYKLMKMLLESNNTILMSGLTVPSGDLVGEKLLYQPVYEVINYTSMIIMYGKFSFCLIT